MTPAKRAALALHATLPTPHTSSSPEERLAFSQQRKLYISLHDDNWPKKVEAFRALYQLDRHNMPELCNLPWSRLLLHRRMLAEEFAEQVGLDKKEADDLHQIVAVSETPSLAEQIDGLLDLIYVALGTMLEMGLSPTQINLLMEEVHASNMTKTDDQGRPLFSDTGKVLKGDNYQQADIANLLIDLRRNSGEATHDEPR